MWSLSAPSKTVGSYKKAWVLLAKNDYRCCKLCKILPYLPSTCQLHIPTISILAQFYCQLGTWTIIGPISPSSKGHRFILEITDYFSKWAKVDPMREVKIADVFKFVKYHVIYHFRVSRRIIYDKCPNLLARSSHNSIVNLKFRTLHLHHTILQQTD